MTAVRAVLLDMGGVLLEMGNPQGLPTGRLDFRGREAVLDLLRSRGARLRIEQLETLVFAPWRGEHERRSERGREADWHPHLSRLRRASGSRLRDLTLLAAWFAPYAETIAPNPAARETLDALLARGAKLALVSNAPLPGALYARLLARHDLARGFESLQWSYDAGSRKPSPAMLRAALSALGVTPGSAVMVGDRRGSDVAAGRAAGLRTVWLRSEDGGGPPPDRTIDRLVELPGVVAAWT